MNHMARGCISPRWQTFLAAHVLFWWLGAEVEVAGMMRGNLHRDGRLTLSNAPEAAHFTAALIEN